MSSPARSVTRIIEPQLATDGAGVTLKRSIATSALDHLDPFLLFDHFGSDNPDDYLAGFPMHPHRGIDTVTYMLAGVVHHRDSIGNAGTISAGDVQWMSAGRGILHEEMPERSDGEMAGFQLWVNLPASLKMSAPRYQNLVADAIPATTRQDGTTIRVIAGEIDGVHGPVAGIAADPTYLDVVVPVGTTTTLPIEPGHAAFAYCFEGEGTFGVTDVDDGTTIAAPRLVILGDGDHVRVRASDHPARFLLIAGKPLGEPIARYGPFVMNTRAEIEQTLRELRDGTFGQDPAPAHDA